MERIDATLTDILVKTDQQYAKCQLSPWSPELHQAFLEHYYWQTHLTQKFTHQNYKHVLNNLVAQMKTAPATTGSIIQNLHLAQHQLREIKRAMASQREAYLDELTKAVAHSDDCSKRKLILHLKMAEQNCKCFNLHHNYMKLWSTGAAGHTNSMFVVHFGLTSSS